ncbi:hypothetical protein AB0H71_33645 [Nocardia sp. NPDC050697]|uniref:hypothetical protein n=1 Tax=Nocardia sp. NPDC050697 TaxID=3155158 RepID=UPI0034058F63
MSTPDNVVQFPNSTDADPAETLAFFSGGNRYKLDRKTGIIAKVGKDTRRAVLPFVPEVHEVMVDLDEDDLQDRKLYTVSVGTEQTRVTHRQVLTGDVWAEFSVSGTASRGMVNVLADAVLRLAEDHETTPLHRHTGWTERDGRPVYLTGDACIGADGPVPGFALELGPRIGAYALPAPPDADQERDAVRASLDLLNLAPGEVMWPLLLMTYLPVMELLAPRPDFLGVLYGPSDTCKSVLAGIGLSHYSPRSLLDPFPQNFSSTRVSLETYAYGAKNALQVIDDAHPASNRREATEINEKFEYLARTAANGSARGRGSRSGGDRKDRPPRGFAMVTAELKFKVPSAENRSFVVGLQRGQVDKAQLNHITTQAAAGVYATAMAGFVRYIARQAEAGRTDVYRAGWAELRGELVDEGRGRSASHLAHLLLTAQALLDYASEIDAIDERQAEELYGQVNAALVAVDATAAAGRVEIDPVTRWTELLREAFDSKQAHVESMTGHTPEDSTRWGWENLPSSMGGGPESQRRGLMLGNLSEDGRTLYLIPKATHELLSKMAGGEGFGLDDRALNDRLGEAGVILSRTESGQARCTHQVRIGGGKPRRLWVATAALDTRIGAVPSEGDSEGDSKGDSIQGSELQERSVSPLSPVSPQKNGPSAKNTGNAHRAHIAERVAAALAKTGGDAEAATRILVATAIPDAMALLDATRAGSRYDHTAHPAEPEILRKPAKGAANAIWEARPRWTNPATPHGTVIAPLDVNAAYLQGMTTHLPIGALQHQQGPEFDRKRSGVYLTTPGPWNHDRLPNPLGHRTTPGPVWLTRPTLQLLTDLSTDAYGALCEAPIVHESWTSGSSEGLLRTFKELLRDARAEAIATGDTTTETYVKAMYSKFVSTMAKSSRYNHDLERTDWGHIIRAQAHANLWRRAHKADAAGLLVHRVTGVDELHVAGDWRAVWPEGRGLGEMKPKGDTYRAGEA